MDLRPFWLALQFLTRLPTPMQGDISSVLVGRSLLFYPLVGLLIGVLLWVAHGLFSALPAMVLAALLLALWVLITGGLHLDGLADSADAWVGGHGDSERTLAIMKDPYCGPMGVTAVVMVLLLKFTALQALVETNSLWMVIAVPVLARAAIPLLLMTTPYVRPGGLGEALANYLPEQLMRKVLLVTAVLVLLLLGWNVLWLLLGIWLVGMGLRSLMLRRIGGATGDTLGAMVEILEAVALLGLVLFS